MIRVRFLGLGARLAAAGGRPAWIRLGLMSVGFALGCGLLIGSLSIVPAVDRNDDRYLVRFGDQLGGPGRDAPDVVLAWASRHRYGDLDLQVWVLEPRGAAPLPPGLERIPEPGELFASPALAEEFEGPDGAALERRLHGRVAGLVGEEGLRSPDELFAYVGKPALLEIGSKPMVIGSYTSSPQTSQPPGLGSLLLIAVLASVVLIPIWLFVATVTRLSASTREARWAAVRLAGGTQGQVRWLAAMEAGVASLLGTLAGLPLFLAVRPLLASGLLGQRFFLQDFAPPLPGVLAVVVGLPLLSVAITLVTMRRLMVSPLGVARRHRKAQVRSASPFVLLIGVGVLSWAASQHAGLMRRGTLEAELIVGVSLTLIALGLGGTAVWLSWLIARRVASRAPSVSALLGMRRLEAEPSATGRIVGGVAVLIALVGVVHAGLAPSQHPDGPVSLLAGWASRLEPGTVIVLPNQSGENERMAALAKLGGIESLRLTRRVPTGGYRPRSMMTAVITTDGDPSTVEALRDEVAWVASVDTVAQLRQDYVSDAVVEAGRIDRLVTAATLFLLLVIGATFLVATVDWIMERGRTLAVLSAVGVRAGVIRRALLMQIGLPLATSAVMGMVGGLVVIALLYTAVEAEVVLPYARLATLAGVVALVILLVSGLATPWLRIAQRPDLLRNE